jgi:hypothetical protein
MLLKEPVLLKKNRGNAYAFGFNGKENDNEVKGTGFYPLFKR